MKDKDLERVRVCAMGKQELARLYGRGLKDGSALNRLAEWINGCPGLMARLEQTGYRKRQKVLTSRQVALIFEYLGDP